MTGFDPARQWPGGHPLDDVDLKMANEMAETLVTAPGIALSAFGKTVRAAQRRGAAVGAFVGFLAGAVTLWALATVFGWLQ